MSSRFFAGIDFLRKQTEQMECRAAKLGGAPRSDTELQFNAYVGSGAQEDRKGILVVDDDDGIRALLTTTLRRQGYTIHEARNGREALVQMRDGTDDLVLLDLMMPEVSGWEVLKVRKTDDALRRMPVIIISANRAPEIGAAVGSEICAFLPKPFDLDLLHSIVRSCLAHPHGPDPPERTE